MDKVIKEVNDYISFVTQDIKDDITDEKLVKVETKWEQKIGKKDCEVEQNSLIQAVLRDFFP